ncbi:RidA family protein [Mesorhizobium sp. B2-8-5]|uniref:RidA family protein n=1 Tax=Mesorhizobium sp. B2-8-5 TaxID=2589903 RepID=UPI00112B1466|nr:RidA family protein [Mesorhizobium sp. B2-8-5]UCI28029.1 RidA family protein [Mesorhizobium sp. B2-8-5]
MTARLRLGKLLARVSKAASSVPNSSEWIPKRVECRGNDLNFTLRRIEATLAGTGLSRSDIVSCTCYLVRKEDLPGFNQAYHAFFSEDTLPVRTTVVADLVLDALLEISIIAQCSDK